MEFKEPYLLAMRERAPKMFIALRRSGQLDQHLQERSKEAHDLLRQLLNQHPNPGLQEKREAEEIVRATLIDFPPEETTRPERLEPPDDLNFPGSGKGRQPGEYQALRARIRPIE